MKRYRVAVCKGPECRKRGADGVFATLSEEVARRDLAPRCELYRGGCYGLCEFGPNLVIREHHLSKKDPFSREDFQLMECEGESYYGAMTADKARQVAEEHLTQDAPVLHLLGTTPPES